jgi:hypothetical protein
MKILALLTLLLLAPALAGCATCGDCGEAPGCYICRPEAKPVKKVIYECKLVPYCEHKLPHGHDCDCCPQCEACPKFKRVLLKREIEVGCEWDCVPEEVPCCDCPASPWQMSHE